MFQLLEPEGLFKSKIFHYNYTQLPGFVASKNGFKTY